MQRTNVLSNIFSPLNTSTLTLYTPCNLAHKEINKNESQPQNPSSFALFKAIPLIVAFYYELSEMISLNLKY